MSIFDKLIDVLLKIIKQKKELSEAEFIQYHHKGKCDEPCEDCIYNDRRIFSNDGNWPDVGEDNHPYCDCYYTPVEERHTGLISLLKNNAPDVYFKLHGRLPDYYITKKQAEEIYGWNSRRNTLAGKAPGKMIGGDVYMNDKEILPIKEGRVWYECDIDYFSGHRGGKRLYYSNDGLMFYSDRHDEGDVIRIV